MAATLFALNVADYFTTIWALNLGGMELNPVMAPLISTPYAPLLKIVLPGIVCYLIAKRLRFTVGVAALSFVTVYYALVVSWNSANLALYYF